MKKISALRAAVIVLTVAAVQPSQAAGPENSGKAEFDAYVTFRPIKTIDGGVGQTTIAESDGFDRLVGGHAPFDLLTFRCLVYRQKVGEKLDVFNTCIKTDKDGDQIFYTSTSAGWTFVGGTGKFKGITGRGVVKISYRHDSGDRGSEFIAHHEGEWEIK